jgi:hypothetical protein
LVFEEELFLGDGRAQQREHLQAARRIRVIARIVELDARVLALRCVERDVRVFEQRLRIVRMQRAHRNANAGAQRDRDALDRDGLLDDQKQLLRKLADLGRVFGMPEDGELIAAHAGDLPIFVGEMGQSTS